MRTSPHELLIPDEVADLLCVAPSVLREMRKTRSGPRYIALSPRQPRYDFRDLAAYLVEICRRLGQEAEVRRAAWERDQARAARKHLTLVHPRRPRQS